MKSITELRDFFAAIPEDQWTIKELESDDLKKRCALGHLNYYLHGNAHFEIKGKDASDVIDNLGINPWVLVDINNAEGYDDETPKGSPKERVINYLNEKITAAQL